MTSFGNKYLSRLSLLTVALVVAGGLFRPVLAADAQPKGLLITPLRTFLKVDAGSAKNSILTVANTTDKTLDVSFSVEQFSVADYTYNYKFEPTQNNWLKLETDKVVLEPGKSKNLAYALTIPEGTAPGGQYFTIFATTHFDNGGVSSLVQAASLLYITINGELRQTTTLKNGVVTKFSFGNSINYSLDVENTGNTHFFVYESGHLSGLPFVGRSDETAHLLLPGSIRTMTRNIPTPLLPGVYKATYGYRSDTNENKQKTAIVIYIPPWSLVAAGGAYYGGVRLVRRRRSRKPKNKTTDS